MLLQTMEMLLTAVAHNQRSDDDDREFEQVGAEFVYVGTVICSMASLTAAQPSAGTQPSILDGLQLPNTHLTQSLQTSTTTTDL